MAAKANLTLYQGDDYSHRVTIKHSDGSPADVTGWTFSAQIRADYADAAPVALADLACTIADPLAGELVLTLDHEVTATLPTDGALRWDLERTDSAGEVFTYVAGTVKVSPEVTR